MSTKLKINNLELNDNIAFPCDEIEKGINFIAEKMEEKASTGSLNDLIELLDQTRQKIYYRHDLKQGLIYKLMGEYYLARGEKEFARFSLEIAADLLKNYKTINHDVKYQLRPLL